MLKTKLHSSIALMIISFTLILSSCDANIFSYFTQTKRSELQTLLEPTIPYLTENYRLPKLDNHPDGVTVQWRSEQATITEDQELLYFATLEDQTILLQATLNHQSEVAILSFPLLVKSQLQVPVYEQRPILRIQLNDGKQENHIIYENYLRATATVSANANGIYQTKSIPSPLGIRTRGHSTRFMPKRPYRIRFDQNTSLYGMKAAKNYILLANYLDRSLVRNALVTYLSYFYETTIYPLDYRFVDLYINQVYLGQYLLMERVEFQKNRLNIEPDLRKEDAGFMLELDYQVYVQNQGNENLEWFKINDRPYVIKEPNPLDYDSAYQFKHTFYIKNYFQQTRNALLQKTNYEQFIDVENWVHYFLVQEIVKNVDINWGSVFMVKASGEKLKHMPFWDHDLAFGNASYMLEVNTNGYYPEGHWGWQDGNVNDFFNLMMKIPAIKNRFKEELAEFSLEYLPKILLWLDQNEARMHRLSQANFQLFPMNQCSGWCPIPNELTDVQTIQGQWQYLRSFLQTRVAWMINHI